MSRRNQTGAQRGRLHHSRWVRAAAGLLLWAGSNTLAGRAAAQTPAAPATPAATAAERPCATVYHLNKRTIQLPIQLEEQYRPMLKEIQLYYKAQPSAPWTLKEKAPPTQASFTFQAPHDGTYWFTMVTVDRQGRSVPADVSREEPALTVVVDCVPPQAELLHLGSVPDGQMIQCDVHDEHLDPSKTRVQYQTADKVFRDLEPVPDRPNAYCIPAQANITGQVRVFASDLAGNPVSREYSLAQLPTPAKAVSVAPPATAPSTMPSAEKVSAPALLPGSLGSASVVVPQGPPVPMTKPAATPVTVSPNNSEIKPVAHVTPKVGGEPPLGVPVVPPTPAVPQTAPAAPPAPAAAPRTIAAKREGVPTRRQLIGTNRLFLEYKIEQAGASGVGRVEVWCTRDKGQSWHKLCEDQDRKSPVEVLLPGDGVYGLSLVVTNGLGFGGQPPQTGDTPDWWIEVDSTRPVAQITTVRLVPEDVPVVHITWTSQDRNFGSGPAELSYAVSRQGPWLPVAKNLKSEGQYRWTPPLDIGAQAFLRLTVRDLAGNVTITETTNPVALDDLSRPRAHIAGISIDPAPAATPAPKTGD